MFILHMEPCNIEIWNDGFAIADMSVVPSKDMEVFCAWLNVLGRPNIVFDWHSQAGHAMLLYLGDYERAKALVLAHGPTFHNSLGRNCEMIVFDPDRHTIGRAMRGRLPRNEDAQK